MIVTQSDARTADPVTSKAAKVILANTITTNSFTVDGTLLATVFEGRARSSL